MLLMYLALMCARKEEVGYIFSEGKQRFLTRDGVNIVLAKYDESPLKFRMKKMGGGESSNVLFYPVPGMEGKVADFAAYSHKRWHFYPEHGKWNQRTRLVLMPGNNLKIVIGDKCLGINDDMVIGETCKEDGDDNLQIFSWIPIAHRRKVKEWVRYNRSHRPSRRRHLPLDEDEGHGQESSRYDNDASSSSDYQERGRRSFHEFDYDGGPGGYGPFNSGMGSFGSKRRRYRHDDEVSTEERDEESYNDDRYKDCREGKVFRKKRSGGLLKGGRTKYKASGTRENDGNAHQGRDLMLNDIVNPEFVNYLDNSPEYEHGAIEENSSVPCDDSILMFGGDGSHCNMGGAGENEICKINKTTMAFRKEIGITI
ncbi:hypothetical protein KMI_01g02150 [Encephalitozoon hellem]|nr:hypothetical protein KMI_01g02150 [Encephalitozoon hellem]